MDGQGDAGLQRRVAQLEREADRGNGGQTEKSGFAAEVITGVTGERGAERGADPGGGAHNALAEIEMSGAAREVGDHERHHHAQHGCGQAVEKLHRDQQVRILDGREQDALASAPSL